MKHFEWTDFARGLVQESARVAMEDHLASGCRKCRHTADLLQKAAVAARSDSKVQVPEYAVRFARAIFILQLPEKVRLVPRAPARLLYDCFREPLPAGVRTQQGDEPEQPCENPSFHFAPHLYLHLVPDTCKKPTCRSSTRVLG